MEKFEECWELDYVDEVDKKTTLDDETLFYITNKRGANSTGYAVENGFVVKAGSKISDTTVEKFEVNYPNAYRLREKLCSDGTIINGVFQNDYEFDSISLAASLILGRNARGQKEWVDINGFPFDENEKNNYVGVFNINDESTFVGNHIVLCTGIDDSDTHLYGTQQG